MTKTFSLEPAIIRTPLDELGSLLDVPRIPGEELKDYSERLLGAYARRSSSTYQGLLNGINRGLGLEEKDAFKINIRALLQGEIDGSNLIKTQNSVQDILSYSGTVDGSDVTATGQTFKDTNANYTPGRLRGLTLTIGTESYKIRDNTATEVYITEGNMSSLVGLNFTIALNLEDNELSGLGLRLGNSKYRIDSNDSNTIYVTSGNLLNNFDTNYRVTALNPKVDVTASYIRLFKEFQNDSNYQLDLEIDLRGELTFHKQIIDEINATEHFEAEDLLSVRDKVLNVSLKKQSSQHIVARETVPAARFFQLKNSNIKEGSAEFAESTVFLREVDEDSVSQQKGNYYIEYETGTVLTNVLPSGNKTVSYVWNEFPFNVTSSPAIVNPLADKSTEDFLFSQVEMKFYETLDERFQPGQPKGDMIEFASELISVKPLSWGE